MHLEVPQAVKLFVLWGLLASVCFAVLRVYGFCIAFVKIKNELD